MAGLRDELYRKEREAYDLRNQINLAHLRLGKEEESRRQVEGALAKSTDRFGADCQKYSSSLNNASKDNETLLQRLNQAEKDMQSSDLQRLELEEQLNN